MTYLICKGTLALSTQVPSKRTWEKILLLCVLSCCSSYPKNVVFEGPLWALHSGVLLALCEHSLSTEKNYLTLRKKIKKNYNKGISSLN